MQSEERLQGFAAEVLEPPAFWRGGQVYFERPTSEMQDILEVKYILLSVFGKKRPALNISILYRPNII